MSNDVTSCAITGETFTITTRGGQTLSGWELLGWADRPAAVYTAGQAAAWCSESLDMCRADFINWAAGVKVRAADSGRKPTVATSVVEHSDQYKVQQHAIAAGERLRRVAVSLEAALKFMTTENTNA